MGNCQCQNDTSLQFPNPNPKTQITVSPLTNPLVPTQPHPQLVKFPTHEPLPTFAKEIPSFPELDKKIIEIDQSLGEFRGPNKDFWNESYEPVYIKRVYRLHNGILYQGQWHKGAVNGEGKFYLPDGSFVRGFSINNQLVGQARLIRENGNYYQGQVKNNKANGEGIMYENGVLYRGNFVDNFLQGAGSQVCPAYKFQGKYHCGARIYGKLAWDLQKTQPTVYEGGFFDQQFNGEGKLTNQIGQYVGSFENGKKKGKGIFTWKNGERFEGMYDSDLKNGEGRMYNGKNVVVLQGSWQNDKFKM